MTRIQITKEAFTLNLFGHGQIAPPYPQIVVLRSCDKDQPALSSQGAVPPKGRHADRYWHVHLNTERSGVLNGADGYLPDDLSRL
jgi:hypothetical protein